LGSRMIARDGYVVDFGNIKVATRKICKELNEHFLCPTLSDVLDITVTPSSNGEKEMVTLVCQDGSTFVFPKNDCAMLPIAHATAEELAIYLWSRILAGLDAEYLRQRGIHTMEVVVAEAVGQEAVFRLAIPEDSSTDTNLDVRAFIMDGEVKPRPCPSAPYPSPKQENPTCSGECKSCSQVFTEKLQRLAKELNKNVLPAGHEELTAEGLEAMLAESE
jgi:6-pyruvoyl-tetrahydropterin synthase